MTSGLRVLVVGTDAAFARALCDVVAAQLPGAACDTLLPEHVRARPEAGALVIDARDDAAQGVALAARVRAMGFPSGIVVLAHSGSGEAPGERPPGDPAHRLGFAVLAPDAIPERLVPHLAEQMAAAEVPYADQVMRARRLVSAGEIALRLQHALNNPIAGIMAEAQLMQFDAVSPEHAEALKRMVALCRRMVELTRNLDGIGERNPRPS
jgi:signal transduction histidine kinase